MSKHFVPFKIIVRQLCHVVAKTLMWFASVVVRMVQQRESGLTSSHTYIKLQPP